MKIGVLGAGQLGRMLALAGLPLGFEFRFLDPAEEACAATLAPTLRADYLDQSALADFCSDIDIATFEFENVPLAAAEFIAARVPLRPGVAALAASQDRLFEKRLFEKLGIPVAAFAAVDADIDSLKAAVAAIGLPAVLKTRRLGYDGKGQAVLRVEEDIDPAWRGIQGQPMILEAFVPFEREVSCVGVRALDGHIAFYALTQNCHHDGILKSSRPLHGDPISLRAEQHACRVLEHLDYCGVFAFEFFVHNGQVLANEMAPRVHNSGHWTIDGAVCSQFENHLRAITGMPLGSSALRGSSLMLNCVGSPPDIDGLLAIEGAHLHLYGKRPKPKRKLGHVTITGETAAQVDAGGKRAAALIPRF